MIQDVVIVGGGHGGFQAAESLRLEGFMGPIHLITDESHLPCHKPPLSKAFLTGKQTEEALYFRPLSFYKKNEIDIIFSERVEKINTSDSTISLRSGKNLPYDKLILCTGGKARWLNLEGSHLKGIFVLRNLEDAKLLQTAMIHAKKAVVIGAGFIGLEFAAAAVEKGIEVTVLEAQSRIMSRVLPEVLSNLFLKKHKEHGVHVLTGVNLKCITGNESVSGVQLEDGTTIPADIIVLGIGVTPNDELAKDAGLACENGILVNALLQTSISNIYAIGDCANHPNHFAGKNIRIESVQNAVEQARTVAATITQNEKVYHVVPWFWTEQYDIKLQMAGFSIGYDRYIIRQFTDNKFSILYYKSGKLIGVDSVNAPADHLAARKLLQAGISPPSFKACNTEVKLSQFLENNEPVNIGL